MATRRRAAATGEQLARISGPFVSCNRACCNLLQRRDFRGLLTLRALRYFERDLLIFLQRLEAVALNLRKMREQVFAASVRRDESKSLRIVKPLHSTCCHSRNPLNRVSRKAARTDLFFAQASLFFQAVQTFAHCVLPF